MVLTAKETDFLIGGNVCLLKTVLVFLTAASQLNLQNRSNNITDLAKPKNGTPGLFTGLRRRFFGNSSCTYCQANR